LRAECEDFIRAIKTGEEPRSGGRWGVEVVKVLDTASRQIQRAWLESPTDNKTVAIP
jgi:hypothetical protein